VDTGNNIPQLTSIRMRISAGGTAACSAIGAVMWEGRWASRRLSEYWDDGE